MKHVAGVIVNVLALALVSCDTPDATVAPTIPTVTLKRSAPCTPAVIGEGEATQVDDHFAGARWVWDITVQFYTTPCASDVNAKVYFIFPGEGEPGHTIPDGRRKAIGAVDAPAIADVTYPLDAMRHQFTVQWILPKEWASYPDYWRPKFYVAARAGGKPIGDFTFFVH